MSDNDIISKSVNDDNVTAMTENGLPPKLITHVASLFKRAPVPAYEKELESFGTDCGEVGESPRRKHSDDLNDAFQEESKENPEHLLCEQNGVGTGWWTKIPATNEVSHFENLQSTNWNSLRFKSPPSVDSDIGWRVEFRPLDI